MPSIRKSAPRHSNSSKRDPTPSGLAAPQRPELASCLAPAVAAAVGTEAAALRPRVPRRSQQQLVKSHKLAERLQEQNATLEKENSQALADAAVRAWQRSAASLSC